MATLQNVYILIDVDCISIKRRAEAVYEFANRLSFDGYTTYKVGIVSKQEHLLNDWHNLCINYLGCTDDRIVSIRAAAGNNSADMLLCFIAGYWCKENENQRFPFIILSADRILKKVEIYIKVFNIECLNYELNLNQFFEKKELPIPIEFSIDKYPYIYDKLDIGIPYLNVIDHPYVTDHPIVSIPIPIIGEELTLGSLYKDSEQHISLDYWDQGSKHSMYPINIFLGYNHNHLFVRSAHGYKKKKGCVAINNQIVDSSKGNIILKNGDLLKVGNFLFKVVIPLLFSERELLKTDNPDPNTVINNTEIMLHKCVKETLQKNNKNWWTDLVREEIRTGCEERNDSGIEHSYNYIFIKDLDTIITDNWNCFKDRFIHYFLSKNKFKRALSHFIMARNKVMHPTRMELTEDEMSFINDFYCAIQCVTK